MTLLIPPTNWGEYTAAADWLDSGSGAAPSLSVYATLFGAAPNGQGKAYPWGVNSDSWVKNCTGHATGFFHQFASRTGFSQNVGQILLRETGTVHLQVNWSAVGIFTLLVGASLVGTGAGTYSSVNTAYHMELDYVIADAGGSATLKINGVTEITFSGDTKNGGTGVVNQAAGTTSSTQQYMADFVWMDNSGSAPWNAAMGVVRVLNSFAATAGASGTAWTPLSSTNASNIDDPINVHDSDTTYNSANAANTVDWFTYSSSDFTAFTGTIKGVIFKWWSRTPDAGVHTMRGKCKKGGTTTTGTSQSITASYTKNGYFEPFANDPATAAAWASFSAVTTAEYAYEMVT